MDMLSNEKINFNSLEEKVDKNLSLDFKAFKQYFYKKCQTTVPKTIDS